MSRLIVVVPGLGLGLQGWKDLIDRLNGEDALEKPRWLLWDHHQKWYSIADPYQLAIDLRAQIDQEWLARGPFDDLVLVGHSIGGVLIRQAYLLACGADHLTRHASPWAPHVSRILMFAGTNRGVDPSRSYGHAFASWLGRRFPVFQRFLAWHLLRGSAFITNLRIQWIRYFAGLGEAAPTVVQLLGTADSIVRREDSIDVEQFPTAYYIEIPGATHANLHRLDIAQDKDGRYAVLRDAFIHARPHQGEKIQINGPGQVVFVLHGIRASNKTWATETKAAIAARWPTVETIAPQYKYLSALRFAIPMTRRRYLQWFQDAYSEALARNPQASFNFIGHSNGTYLFGESLRSIPGMKFERAVLVGSVLPEDYDWGNRVQREQIKAVRVDGSCFDWPVGWLCSALRGIWMNDIGTGGFEGFTALPISAKTEFFYYRGGHSAPLATENLPALAEFAVTGTIVAPQALCGEVVWFSTMSRALRVLAPFLALSFLLLTVGLIFATPFVGLLFVLIILIIIFVLAIV
jgi:hypothetical protein